MTEGIRPLKESELDAYVEIMAGAYPGLKIVSDADRQHMRERLASTYEDPSTTIYGLMDNGRLQAGMILYDFTMNVRRAKLAAGGLGSLAVDLLNRKRKLGKRMVSFYLDHYRRMGVPLALLYPFRTDFYRRMGFGYGTKMSRYIFRPLRLRAQDSGRTHIQYLNKDNLDQVLACFDGYAADTHGMIMGSRWRLKQMLSNAAIRTVGYVEDGHVLGYVAFDFENQKHFLKNDLRVRQLLYRKPVVLNELLAFLRSLADQVEWIVINTQDDYFHHLLDDPRNRTDDLIPSVYHESNTQGVGLMYRATDLSRLFESAADMRFGSQSLSLKITVEDTFIPENNQSLVIRFRNGSASLSAGEDYDAEISMNVSDFSSMFIGAITVEQLVDYGQARVSSDGLVKQISKLFATDMKPICLTAF